MNIARNVLANYLGRAYSMASIYFFTPFYLKYLGLAAYGIVSFYGILLAIGALVDAGLTATLSREAARTRDRKELLIISVTIERILLVGSTMFALMVCLGAQVIARHWLVSSGGMGIDELASSIRMMALTIPAQLGVSLCVGGMLGLQKQTLGNAVQALYVTVRGGLIIPVLAYHSSLELFLGWQLGASWLMLLVARTAYFRAMGCRGFELGRASLRVLAPARRYAAGMLALTVLAGVNTQLDKAVVSKLFSLEQFGIYSLAAVLAQLPFTLISPLTIAMLPRLTAMVHNGNEAGASELHDRFANIIALIAAIGSFGLVFFAREALAIWLGMGSPPAEAVNLVRTLAIGSLLLSLGAAPFYLGLAHGHNRTSVVTGIATSVAFVPVMMLAIEWRGLSGAAVPWVLLNMANLIAVQWVVFRRFHMTGPRPMAISLSLVALAAGVIWAARMAATALTLAPLAACALAGAFVVAMLCALALALRNRSWLGGFRPRR